MDLTYYTHDMTEKIKQTYVHLPVWLATALVTFFMSIMLLLFNSINNRLDRLETMIINHITNTVSYDKK